MKMHCNKLFNFFFAFWSQIRSYWPSGNACGPAVRKSRCRRRKWSIHRPWLHGKTASGILHWYGCFGTEKMETLMEATKYGLPPNMGKILVVTSMHSSRMCTDRWLTVSRGRLPSHGIVGMQTPSLWTDTCENITFTQLRWQVYYIVDLAYYWAPSMFFFIWVWPTMIYFVLLHRCTCSDMIQLTADTRVR